MGARGACGKALGYLLRNLCTLKTWDALSRLLLFPKYVLQMPARWGTKHRNSNLRSIIQRAQAIMEHPIPDLWAELNSSPLPRRSARKRTRPPSDGEAPDPYDEFLEGRLQSLIAEGALGKAAKHLVSEGIHEPGDPTVTAALRDLHPQPDNLPTFPDCPSWGECLLEDSGERRKLIKEAILSFPAGCAPGPSGLRPRHLQDILQGDQQGITSLLQGLALPTECCEMATFTSTAALFLCYASLIALKKPGNKVRPVAVGETLRRVVEKYLMALPQTKDAASRFLPHQYGLGLPRACESLGRSLQHTMDRADLPPDWAVLQVDVKNAFNAVDRTAVLKGISFHCPHLLPWAFLSLGVPSRLISQHGDLWSSQGVQQGSPLGPLFFNSAIHSIIRSCPSSLDWNVWYMDDGTFLGKAADLESALSFITAEFQTIGLEINLSKKTLWGPLTAPGNPLGPARSSILRTINHISFVPGSGVTLLGVPIHYPNDPTFVRTQIKNTLDTLRSLTSSLTTKLRDSQTQLALLRGCFSACKYTFLLRCTMSWEYRDLLAQADIVLKNGFQKIIGTQITDQQWTQVTLPYSHGGLGLQSPLQQAPAATIASIASWMDCADVQKPKLEPNGSLSHLHECLCWLLEQTEPTCQPLNDWIATSSVHPVDKDSKTQSWWQQKISDARRSRLVQDAPPRDAARLKCQNSALCSAWSRAPPSAALGTKIPRQRFQFMTRWHIGASILTPSSAGKPCPLCSAPLDIFGDHAVSCPKNHIWRRHFLAQDFLLRLGRAAGFQITREQSLSDSLKREADLLIQNWEGTTPLAIDLTIRHPGISDADKSLLRAEDEKRKGAARAAEAAGVLFEPLVFHVWGGLPSTGTSKQFFNTLLNRIAENRPGLDKERKVEEITEGLSCILMSQLAEQLLAVLSSSEIPVVPACSVPEFVDVYGNAVPGAPPPSSSQTTSSSRQALWAEPPPDIQPTESPSHPLPAPRGGPPPFLFPIPNRAFFRRPPGDPAPTTGGTPDDDLDLDGLEMNLDLVTGLTQNTSNLHLSIPIDPALQAAFNDIAHQVGLQPF